MTAEDFTIVYSKRRTVGITVERDRSVVVRAPEGADLDELTRVVASKQRWIEEKVRHPQKYASAKHPPGKELVSGESMLYLGQSYRVEVVEEPSDGIRFEGKFFVPRSLSLSGRAAFRKWYVSAAEERLIPRVWDWARRLGVEPREVKIVDNRYRWGSCTPAGIVTLNWRLIKAASAVSDYVIAHELAHLIEPSHNENFWSIVRAQVPRADVARAWLRDNGQLLEEDL